MNKEETKSESEQINIVICSDGTWAQGGSITPSNVWRTYLCVDSENQVKIHDDGVGTGGFRIARILGGATGYGISRNLRELIFQLSLAYRENAKIFLFGFSRGAYTVRVLANLICMFGIPKSNGKPPHEVRSIAADLLRAYKHGNQLRAKGVDKGDFEDLENDQLVAELRAKCHYSESDDFAVHFLGCWDTVAALGVPLQPLKDALMDMFPLSFLNNIPSAKINYLYQALALDEERHSFHAIPWELPDGGELCKGQSMEQVWFPGCHSHVGGSYAKDQLALEALEWMLEKAANHGLRFSEAIRERYRNEASALGQMVDSRSGTRRFYRYFPREISKLQKTGKHVVHAAALERIATQTNGYTCRAIDTDTISVVDNSCSRGRAIDLSQITTGPEQTLTLNAAYQSRIATINSGYMQLGRLLYFVGLLMILPFLAMAILWRNLDPEDAFHAADNPGILQSVIKLVGSAEHLLLGSTKALVPEIIGNTVVKGLMNAPGTLSLFTLFYSMFLYLCARLRIKMQRISSDAWHQTNLIQSGTCETRANDSRVQRVTPRLLPKVREFLIGCVQGLAEGVIEFLLPLGKIFGNTSQKVGDFKLLRRYTWIAVLCLTTLAAAFWGLVPFMHNSFDKFHAYEKLATTDFPASLIKNEARTFNFDTAESNFPTGVFLVEDQEYQITIDPLDDWKDLNIPANPNGVEGAMIHRFRRDHKTALFKVMGQIGSDPKLIVIGSSETFAAHANGHLFLFVNDVPGYYGNNVGKAKVTIRHASSDQTANPPYNKMNFE